MNLQARPMATGRRTAEHDAAILAADVVGYSRLLGEDELRLVAAQKQHRKELPETATPMPDP
jgi:class 3 adenylate cyclase